MLNVTNFSGQTTVTKREVCVEEDVVLDCDAKDRVNPRKIKQIIWKKETEMKHGSSYSKVAALDLTAEADDGFKIHGNGSLLVRKGREEGNTTYKCDVSKTDGSKEHTHLVRVKSIKCKNETQRKGKNIKNSYDSSLKIIRISQIKPGLYNLFNNNLI